MLVSGFLKAFPGMPKAFDHLLVVAKWVQSVGFRKLKPISNSRYTKV